MPAPTTKKKRVFKERRPKPCPFCVERVAYVDYKDVTRLKRFVNAESAKIVPRRVSGACAKHQRVLAIAVKRARVLALLPHTLG